MTDLDDAAYRLVRPLLFRLPPETAQRVADLALKQTPIWRGLAPAFRVRDPRLEMRLGGLRLSNPVGLAAGYDKDCEFLASMAALGFGYVTGGTVTAEPQPGNARPRLLRCPKSQSLVNSLGFPSRGLEFAAAKLERVRDAIPAPVVVSVSGVTTEDILKCHCRLEPVVDAVEVNISSPNTSGLRVFQEVPALGSLLERLNRSRGKPLFVKLPPYAGDEARDVVLSLARVCAEKGVDAVTVANSRPARAPLLAAGAGGVSGRPIFEDMLSMVAEVRREVGGQMAINACGGVFTGQDAWRALRSGATTVQALTGLIYRGPGLARLMNRELLGAMNENP